MEFWGIEVKSGENALVDPEEGLVIHLSQASLGEGKKGDSVVLYVNVGDQKLVIGTLSSEKCPQITYDLVFEKEFTLSHNWKNGSVHFCGYKTVLPEEDDEEGLEFGSDSEEEELPVANGKAPEPAKTSENKANAAKPAAAAAAKSAVKIAEPKKELKKEEDDSEDSSDDDLDTDDSDEDDSDQDSEDDGSDGEEIVFSDSEDEATPTPKKESKKKRPAADSATKTPVPEKKAKIVTPQKSGGDGKKGGGHTATPHPSKKSGKNAAAATAASNEKSKQTPKSGQAVTCKSCTKTFNSDGALQSHTKAKHSGGK